MLDTFAAALFVCCAAVVALGKEALFFCRIEFTVLCVHEWLREGVGHFAVVALLFCNIL